MAAGTQSTTSDDAKAETPETPEISICTSCPGKSVFLEAGNSDGWISSELTVDVRR
jgi:hypothetical protein